MAKKLRSLSKSGKAIYSDSAYSMGSKPTGIPSKAKANADLDNPSSV